MKLKNLPAPRMQLRWEATEKAGVWICHYELVILLSEYDVRRESWDGKKTKILPAQKVIQMGEPTRRDTSKIEPPCTLAGGTRFADAPFRDGVHAIRDADQLGGIPVYVVAPDGAAFDLREYEAKR